MNTDTVTTLIEINRRFYERFAEAFSETRGRPWQGWNRIYSQLAERHSGALAVLDAGCGNGRFGAFLASRWRQPLSYSGFDGSPRLLAAAAESLSQLAEPPALQCQTISEGSLGSNMAGQTFDLVAAFAVLHHLPGASQRRAAVRQLAHRVADNGLLAISTWRLDRRPRALERKTLPWDQLRFADPTDQKRYNPSHEIDLEELEPGDRLLTWGGDRKTPRYCHFASDEEVDSWIDASGLRLVDRFDADGPGHNDNLYLLLEP